MAFYNVAAAAAAAYTLGKGSGGKGGGSSDQTVTTQNPISAAAQPYIENMLGRAQDLSYQPYQTYPTAHC